MNTNQVAHVAALVGEPARTGMLLALMDGRALTAGELAGAAHVSPATASRHLALLLEAGLLRVHQQGRHRYHRLASPEVARVLEGMMQLAAAQAGAVRPRTGPRDGAMRFARTCYDHLAGRLGVAITAHLVDTGAVVLEEDGAALTDRAAAVLAPLGLDAASLRQGSAGSLACRPCLDWGERRLHLAGRFGALLCAHTLQQGWLVRKPASRALELTPAGAGALRDWMGLERWEALARE